MFHLDLAEQEHVHPQLLPRGTCSSTTSSSRRDRSHYLSQINIRPPYISQLSIQLLEH
ncbi:hypothetical protein HanPSC8_Chr05g0196151 [Helianthus annuus]|nr:hypothetical protein HanPSC8_Chr05g0196151 [Helianthus annuus]